MIAMDRRSQARWASYALYGTIGLCTSTTIIQLAANFELSIAFKKRDRVQYDAALRKCAIMKRHFTNSLRNVSEGRIHTLITSAWNHSSIAHYIGNMLGLWSCARNLIPWFGPSTFLSLFYGGALAGNVLCLALDSRRPPSLDSTSFIDTRDHDRKYVGASGGVCSLVSASAFLNPWGMMYIAIGSFPVPIPNLYFPFGFGLFSAWAQTNGFQSDIAHLGHLGGTIYGGLWFWMNMRNLPLVFRLRRRLV